MYNLERFLEQQGLVYVEEPSEQAQTQEELDAGYEQIKKQLEELKKEEPHFQPPDQDVLQDKIQRLNQLAGAKS